MARDYFIQTTSLVPPRGVRVEMTEIRPLRPNQAVILPGVAVLGQSLKFEVKEKSKYRSRNGFAQSDGIAQFSASYHRKGPYNKRLISSSHDDFRPPSYEPYRPSHPRSIFPYCSDDESYLTSSTPLMNHQRSVSFNTTLNNRIKSSFPDLSISSGKPLYPTSKKSLVPILKTDARSKRQDTTLTGLKTNEKIMPNYHNLLFSNSEDELNMLKPNASRSPISIRSGSTSPKFSSHHGLCTNPGRNKATSSLGVLNTYDFLFDRHLRMLTTMESDQEDMINEDEIKALRSINQPLIMNPSLMQGPSQQQTTEDEEESLTESDELSMIGEDLVNRSLAEVTSMLDQQLEISSENEAKKASNNSTKRISFLVPTNMPQISVSSAGSADES